MKINKFFVTLGMASLMSLPAVAMAGKWEMPAIPYGHIHPLPHADVQPSKNVTYKEIFDVTAPIKNARKPDAGLVHVARAVNVFYSAGVPLDHMKFVIIVHGPATHSILKNSAYRAKFGVNNPNLPLIKDLRNAGVKVFVCGQALADLSIPHHDVNKYTDIALSALATVPIYEHKGYGYMMQ